MEAPPLPKNPVKARAGHLGADARWADPAARRMVRLDELTPAQRGVVLALIDTMKTPAGSGSAAGVNAGGGTRDADRQS